MPMYEYTCRKCGGSFEELVRNTADEADLACPACGAQQPERRLSACAVRVGVAVGGGNGGGDFAASMPPASGCGGGGFS